MNIKRNVRNFFPIGSGSPCINHNCSRCCLKTSMPLSVKDLKKISDLGYKLEYFSIKTNGQYHLKNKKGKCVFLKENSCRIYSHRPEGCKIYPLVYDENSKEFIIDYICTFGYEFKIRKKDITKLKRLIRIT